MKKLLKVLGGLLGVVVIGICGLLIYVRTALPNVDPAPDLKIELKDDRIQRGEYLANTVFACVDCHSDKDYTKFGLTIKEGTKGKGGALFGSKMGLPGDYYAKNLTPYYLGDWTDGEIFRAITTGVDKEGNALFPIMPYTNYRRVDKEDIYDIIAYLRTLEPIEYDVPESSSNFPMNFIINTIPGEPDFTERPDPSDKIAYGKYLVTAASCADCHTPMEQGNPIEGMQFAGGMEFELKSGGVVTSANITPDINTGIGSWTEEAFITRFKSFQDTSNVINKNVVKPGEFNTEMPWRFYSNMSEEELSAIYAFLKTQSPVNNMITKFRKEE
ncbi:cytochrome C [Balneola sp. EhC07]|uniref:c-type cytochrome n=1 Tax=Balneola sp. EhC07 TaxID=1849360 RepID=UPI0007F36BF3|nr:cytochrome c [Balneola sp. EhC07]OAN59742.1 cytochrome C [Balneola sp. EhC07]